MATGVLLVVLFAPLFYVFVERIFGRQKGQKHVSSPNPKLFEGQ